MNATVDGHAGHVERLGIDLPVDRHRKEFPELIHVHVRSVQNRLGRILSCSRIVIVLGENAYTRGSGVHGQCCRVARHTRDRIGYDHPEARSIVRACRGRRRVAR